MPQLQTSPSYIKSTTTAGSSQMNAPPSASASTTDSTVKSPTSASHQRFVLTDHVAFRYLEEDPSTTVLSRRQKIEGYEVYLVEQWACSRAHPTFIITTYTGDPKDTVWAGILSVPTDESTWSPQLRIYFKALDDYHARRQDTSLGTLMITNLSGFPSSLTVIPVPEGDVKKHRELFLVNENLKRLGCSGRLGIKLAPPSSATQNKFQQLYRTSDKIPLSSSVIELVKLCQVALVLFGKLEPEYADGLLCDVTEKAITDWWVEFGAEYYTVEPHDGILGPTTVAALLGMLMGARNRLSAYNAPVAKDVFDIESTKRAIAYFQKTQRIQKTRRLDRQTLERLRRATAKAASKEGWGMPRALKSTVAELSGKGGEMVMGMVGAGDKAGISDIETADFDSFIELVRGERAKWLWYGKPRKQTSGDMFSRLPGEDGAASPEEEMSELAKLLKRESTLDDHKLAKRDTGDSKRYADAFGVTDGVDKEKDPHSKRAAIKRATDKIESGTGFTRIKDAVGRRSHQPKASKEEFTNANGHAQLQQTKSDTRRDHSMDTTRTSTTDYDPSFTKTLTETPGDSMTTLAAAVDGAASSNEHVNPTPAPQSIEAEESDASKPPTVDNSIAGSIIQDIENMDEKLPFEPIENSPILLRRTHSSNQLAEYHSSHRNENWWPRHLSFSICEESILRFKPLTAISRDEEKTIGLRAKLKTQEQISEDTRRLQERVAYLSTVDAAFATSTIDTVSHLDSQADADIASLQDMYYARFEEYQSLREDSHEVVSRERLQLSEAVRDLETLGAKLDYEIHTLRGKVDDVDDGCKELERQVESVEERCQELEDVVREKEGWVHWGVRLLLGIGRPPG